jgi:hypothetical protein
MQGAGTQHPCIMTWSKNGGICFVSSCSCLETQREWARVQHLIMVVTAILDFRECAGFARISSSKL